MRVILFALAAAALIPAGIWLEFVHPVNSITADLEADGVTDINLQYRMFSGTIFTRCNHEHATIRSFTGIKNGRYVQGVSCYAPIWGSTHWFD